MSAARPFIDVLVGKLTAYVDASSRPTSDLGRTLTSESVLAASIVTPWWAASLDAVPLTAASAARAYVSQAASVSSSRAARPRPADAGAATFASVTRARQAHPGIQRAPRRTPAQVAAIQLLRRLGAGEIDARSSDAQLRSACRRLLRECHPDTHPPLDDLARSAQGARLRAVLQARSVLALSSSVAGAVTEVERSRSGASAAAA